jgi:hypothetical protein
MAFLCIHHFSNLLLVEEKMKGSKGVLNQQEAQHARKGSINVVFV